MIRVYSYGCRNPLRGEAEAVDQLFRRTRLWNAMVEIERDIRSRWPAPDDAERKEKGHALEAERRLRVKRAQAASELYWCNYEDVRASYEAARKRAIKERTSLKFHRADGSGKVSVRYQTGLPVRQAFGNASDTRLQIDPVPREAWASPSRSVRRKLARTRLRIRVGSNADRTPLWLELPMVMHRLIPEDAIIRNAAVIRERLGFSWRWRAVITVALPDPAQSKERGTVAVDLGWRLRDGGLRVAYWADGFGNHGEIFLTEGTVSQLHKCDDLQSILDKHFNACILRLRELLPGIQLPQPVSGVASHLALWRAPWKLERLRQSWLANRCSGDTAAIEALDQWHERYRHLHAWQQNLRDQILKRRREQYRVFAAWLARTYSRVILEEFDLRGVYEGENRPEAPMVRRNRFLACVSELRLAIMNACAREGVAVERVSSAWTTQRCHVCGANCEFDASRDLHHACDCGALWDQDYNACVNLLAGGGEVRGW